MRKLGKGRARVWWMTHGQRVKYAAMGITMVLLYGIASEMDYQDALLAEQMAHAEARRQLAQEQAARALPTTVYVLEAATPAAAQQKLARLAGEMDVERHKLREAFK